MEESVLFRTEMVAFFMLSSEVESASLPFTDPVFAWENKVVVTRIEETKNITGRNLMRAV
jgi:hypothetical protein